MNVVDSSAWLEFFADGPNAARFAPPILAAANLLVPSVAIYEVFKTIARQSGESNALQAIAVMEQGTVVDFDQALALTAARISAAHKLPLADSIMLATARRDRATLWTQDADFTNIDGVRFFRRRP